MLRLFILSWLAFNNFAFSGTLQISFKDVPSKKGNILYLVFDSKKGFPGDEKAGIRKGSVPAANRTIDMELPEGKYAVSVIHDENKNDKLDTFLGIPREGFGFSQNPRIFFGPPDFDECVFELNNDKKIEIEIKKL